MVIFAVIISSMLENRTVFVNICFVQEVIYIVNQKSLVHKVNFSQIAWKWTWLSAFQKFACSVVKD